MLDAPSLADDFYLNLVDWSAQNVLAVGLGSCVYLWSAANSKARERERERERDREGGGERERERRSAGPRWLAGSTAAPGGPARRGALPCWGRPRRLLASFATTPRKFDLQTPLFPARLPQVTKLLDLSPSDKVCSVSWSQRGTYLSVGTDSGDVQVGAWGG